MAAALTAANMRLDGELWAGRGKWDESNAFMSDSWEGILFKIFDAPSACGGLVQRLESARAALASVGTERVQVVQTARCEDVATVSALLTRVSSLGGEVRRIKLRAADCASANAHACASLRRVTQTVPFTFPFTPLTLVTTLFTPCCRRGSSCATPRHDSKSVGRRACSK
jgi:hypothetical protein